MSAERSRWRVGPAGDPVLVGLVAAVVYALHGYEGALGRDLGVFTYGGEHVAVGVPPYAGIFNSVGPLADAVPGLAIWLGRLVGAGPVAAERVAFTLIAAGCCALLCVLARDTFGSRLAGFVAPAVFLTFEDFSGLASDGPREKTTMVLFLLGALILVGRRRWLGAGACTALATLTWQPVLAVAVAAAGVALVVGRSGRLRGALAFVAGGAIPTALTVLVYAAYGDLPLAIAGFVTVDVEYTHQPSVLSAPHWIAKVLWNGYHGSLVLVLVGLATTLAIGIASVPGAVRREPTAVAVVSLGAAALVGTAWTSQVINGAPDLFELLPFAALGVTGDVGLVVSRLTPRAGRTLVAVVCAVAVVASAQVAVATRSDLLERQRADVAAVLAAAPAGATMLSINAPEVLALAGRTNPSDLQIFDRPIDRYVQHTRPGGLAGYAAWVARIRPTLVVVARGYPHPWPDPLLAQDYRRAGNGPTWTWYLSRASGRAAAAAVRSANRVALTTTG